MSSGVLVPVVGYLLECKGNMVTLDQVITGANRPRRPVLRVMDRLVREGYLQELSNEPKGKGYRDYGPERRNPSWEIIAPPQLPRHSPKRRTIRDRIWAAIRMKRRFTVQDILFVTNEDEASVSLYLRMLVQGGYLRVVGKSGRANTYLLLPSKDCGPKRPMLAEPRKKSEAGEVDHG
jgi:hypothetical protein